MARKGRSSQGGSEEANLQKIHSAHRFMNFRRESLLAIYKYVLFTSVKIDLMATMIQGEVDAFVMMPPRSSLKQQVLMEMLWGDT